MNESMTYDVPRGTKRKHHDAPKINEARILRFKIATLKQRINELEEIVERLVRTEDKRAILGVTKLETTVASIIDPLGPLQTLAERVDALEEWRDVMEQTLD